MKAGRELDALVAEKVMGLMMIDGKEKYPCDSSSKGYILTDPEPYSTDIAAAWLVVEKLRDTLHVNWDICSDSTSWWAKIGNLETLKAADSAPLAICLAALKAVGMEA